MVIHTCCYLVKKGARCSRWNLKHSVSMLQFQNRGTKDFECVNSLSDGYSKLLAKLFNLMT